MKKNLVCIILILSILNNLVFAIDTYAYEADDYINLLSYDINYDYNDKDSQLDFELDFGHSLKPRQATVILRLGDNILYVKIYDVPEKEIVADSVLFEKQYGEIQMTISCSGKNKDYSIDATYTHRVELPAIELNKYTVSIDNIRNETAIEFEAACGTMLESSVITVCAARSKMALPIDLSDTDILYTKTYNPGYDGMLTDMFSVDSENKEIYLYFTYSGYENGYVIDASYSHVWSKKTHNNDRLNLGFEQSYAPVSGTTKEQYEQRRSEISGEIRQIESYYEMNEQSFYVSVAGDDLNNGTIEKPFATIERALKAVRDYQRPANIVIRGGEYQIDKEIEIDSRIAGYFEKPMIIKGYDNEKVVLKQGKSISGNSFVPITSQSKKQRIKDADVREKVLEFDLKNINVSSIDVKKTKLFLNDTELMLSKWPKNGTVQTGEILLGGKFADMHNTIVSDNPNVKYYFDLEEPYTWNVESGIYFKGRIAHEFEVISSNLINADPVERTITVSSGSAYSQAVKGAKHVYCNVFEELLLPGEWCYDKKENKIYIYPTDNFKSSVVSFVPGGGNIIKVADTSNIVFDNIEFINSQDGISVMNSKRVVFQNCTIKNVLNNGISFTLTENCGIINSRIIGTGNIGVMLSGVKNVDDIYTSDRIINLVGDKNFVQNCIISNSERAGIGLYNCIGNIASHNVISDMYRDGIIISRAAENIVEYNEIFGGQIDGIADSGLIYCGGEVLARGNHIRHNYLHDPIKSETGIYFDERVSDNMAYDNIIVNCPKGIFIHTGKDIALYNNLILNNKQSGTQDGQNSYPIADWPTYYNGSGEGENVFQKNVMSDTGEVSKFVNSDLYTSNRWKQRYPKLFTHLENIAKLKKKMADEGEEYKRESGPDGIENKVRASSGLYYENNLIAGNKDIYTTPSAEWTIEENNNYRYDDMVEVGFSDLARYDYSLKSDSSVYINIPGFEDVAFEKMGISRNYKAQINDLYILSPGKNYVLKSDELIINWSMVCGATDYDVYISEYSDFPEDATQLYNTKTLSLTVRFDDMDVGRYYVKIIASTNAKSYTDEKKEYKTFFSKGDADYLSEISCSTYSIENNELKINLKNNGKKVNCNLYLCKKSEENDCTEDVIVDSLSFAEGEEKELSYHISGNGNWHVYAWNKDMMPLMKTLELCREKNDEN